METNSPRTPADQPDERQQEGKQNPEAESAHRSQKLVRLFKTIVLNPEEGKYIDGNVVAYRYYNSFNYSLLAGANQDVNMTVGVTSVNPGDGKTLVASNLAVSLAMGYQRETVLVDLNIDRPRLHEIFGTSRSPGLVESFNNGSIHLSRTLIDHLFVLSAGDFHARPIWSYPSRSSRGGSPNGWSEASIGLEHLAAFRDVMYSLEHEFEFIIVDMPSLRSRNFPLLFTRQLNGVLVVVQAGKTKKKEIDRLVHQLNEQHVLGFVFNHVREAVY